MKKIGLLFITAFIIISVNLDAKQIYSSERDKQSTGKAKTVRDGFIIHITESYDDPHRVLMPLKMAETMSADKDVIVFMDIHAVEMLVKSAKDLTYEDFDTFQTYVKRLLEKKVAIYACPTCLKIAGFKPEDLMDGVQLSQRDAFFNFTKGRIVTLDY